MNISENFNFIPLMASEEKFVEYFFSFLVVVATNQIQRFGQKFYV